VLDGGGVVTEPVPPAPQPASDMPKIAMIKTESKMPNALFGDTNRSYVFMAGTTASSFFGKC
jgi:hypothetical protein